MEEKNREHGVQFFNVSKEEISSSGYISAVKVDFTGYILVT